MVKDILTHHNLRSKSNTRSILENTVLDRNAHRQGRRNELLLRISNPSHSILQSTSEGDQRRSRPCAFFPI